MLFEFATEKREVAAAALIVYAIYKSTPADNMPPRLEKWAYIERYVKFAAKRADTLGEFMDTFKRRMGCGSIQPRWCKTGILHPNEDGEIVVIGDKRDFMLDIIEESESEQEKIVDVLYEQTQRVILLVRDRLERERVNYAPERNENGGEDNDAE